MKKYIIIGFQRVPINAPKVLKEFKNGNGSFTNQVVASIGGFCSAHLGIKYSPGLEGVLIFENKNEASLVAQALSRSWHSTYNTWCVRELNESTTIAGLVTEFCELNRHLYAKYLV